MTFWKDAQSFSSEGNHIEQCAAAEKHFGIRAGRDGEWNMLGLDMVWYPAEELEYVD
ncbi:hypothetical protein J2J97_32340 (plasmid) [Rhizobium bangladeshense]|uniref:hypothetical protein n=1 Tax=Rhizobium bangladeshense TaxID=1138189 RepID=UPI001A984779|nr:hypothetical protein [Rhizobium bangladeshense]QSY98595.1 hypothetical protein J2J97_32340 [Rhizobium bangladeshense]